MGRGCQQIIARTWSQLGKRAKGSPTQMMECVGVSCFDPAGEPEEELAAAPEEVLLLGACEKNWRTEAPTRESLMGACALCHLVYWWQGPQHRSLDALRDDARKHEAPAELAPPCEKTGGGGAYEFQDRKQVHKCVKAVIDTLHEEARVALWLDAIHCVVIVEPSRVIVVFRGTVDADELRDDANMLRLVKLRPKPDRARVHAGFVAHLGKQGCGEKILATVLKEVAARQRLRRPCSVLLTGHSLGAAAATLLALRLDGSSLRMRITLVTFGSPRVGNRHFQRAFDASARLRHYRVQNELDPIARGPWWLPFPGTYRHTGHHVWLDASPSWWRLPGCCKRHRPIVCRWRRDGAIWSAARPVNLLVYPFRWLWNENAADFRTHQIGGKFKKGYLVNLEKAAWDVE
jgi:hypothetical protein